MEVVNHHDDQTAGLRGLVVRDVALHRGRQRRQRRVGRGGLVRHLVERGDGLRLPPIEQGEVALLHPADGVPGLVHHDHIDLNEIDPGAERRLRRLRYNHACE